MLQCLDLYLFASPQQVPNVTARLDGWRNIILDMPCRRRPFSAIRITVNINVSGANVVTLNCTTEDFKGGLGLVRRN